MQNQRKIKVEIDGYLITIDSNKFSVTKDGVFLDGDTEDLTIPQKTWLDNINACAQSFVNSLNFEGYSDGI